MADDNKQPDQSKPCGQEVVPWEFHTNNTDAPMSLVSNFSRIDKINEMFERQSEPTTAEVMHIVFGRDWNITRHPQGLAGLTHTGIYDDDTEDDETETTTPGPKPSIDPRLTDAELQELKDRPITRHYTEFTDEQFQLRLSYAKKLCTGILEMDTTITPEFQAIYEAFPMWGFYTDKSGAKRSFGVATDKDGNSILHTQRAGFGFDNVTLGGTPTKNLVRVDQWSDETIAFLKLTPNPGLYLDPLGFWIILSEQAR